MTGETTQEIYNFFEEKLRLNEHITRYELCDLFFERFMSLDNNSYPIGFIELSDLDNYFFQKNGGFYRSAYNFPEEGDIITMFGEECIVTCAGIFTFDAIPQTNTIKPRQ